MKCQSCKVDTRVIDSRQRGNKRIRRRECPQCKKRFSTTEVMGIRDADLPLMRRRVQKKNGTVQDFDAQKLQKSVVVAVRKPHHKNIPMEDIVERVEQEIGDGGEPISSKRIGAIVLQHLKNRDALAYIRYASVHQEMNQLSDFAAMLKQLQPGEKNNDGEKNDE